MATTLKPEIEARIADLAKRLGFAGPDAVEKVLEKALDDLDAITPKPRRKMTPEEMAEELKILDKLTEAGRRWREEHPDEYDENYPPSIAWQDELYDDQGLPK
jgi:hypothetical protein